MQDDIRVQLKIPTASNSPCKLNENIASNEEYKTNIYDSFGILNLNSVDLGEEPK